MTQGNEYFIKPYSGNDGSHGRDPDHALKSVARAHALMTAGQNDIAFLLSESNVSATTTDYQSTMLTWSKDLCHLIGVNGGNGINPRSRIAQISTWTSADPLMTVSADGCYIAGLSLWSGVTDATTLGCLKVTGQRNLFERLHVAGMGNAATNDIAGAYSLLLSGAAENDFRNCIIGVDIQNVGASVNSQILTAAGSFDNRFFDCEIRLKAAHATNTVYLRVPTTTMLGQLKFNNCVFSNNGASTLTYGAVIHASAGGKVYFKDCAIDATDVASADEVNIFVDSKGGNNASSLFVVTETT
jgi:hypothetical protein